MTVNETIKLVCDDLGIHWNPSEISQRGILLHDSEYTFPCLCQNIFDKEVENDNGSNTVTIDFYIIVDKGVTDDVGYILSCMDSAVLIREDFVERLRLYLNVDYNGSIEKAADVIDMEAGNIFTLDITYYPEC